MAGAPRGGEDVSAQKKQLDDDRKRFEEHRRQVEEQKKAVDIKQRQIEEKERALADLDRQLKKRKEQMDQLEISLQKVCIRYVRFWDKLAFCRLAEVRQQLENSTKN